MFGINKASVRVRRSKLIRQSAYLKPVPVKERDYIQIETLFCRFTLITKKLEPYNRG